MMNHIRYLLIGNGRVASHFAHYFRLLDISFDQWFRSQDVDHLQTLIPRCDVVLLAISDSALRSFYTEHIDLWKPHSVVHFSGCLELPSVFSAHPLMTFGPSLYTLSDYQKISFVTTQPGFAKYFPVLSNSHFQIQSQQKPYYHAHCVASGNFSVLLWQKMAQAMSQLGLPDSAFLPYLDRTFENMKSQLHGSLTGPLARKDFQTVQLNQRALEHEAFHKIYSAFVEVYFPEASQKGEL